MDKRSYNKRQVGTEKENLAAEYLKKKGISSLRRITGYGRARST